MPIEADDAGDAADHDRHHLLEAVARCRATSNTQIGVSRPTKWPTKITRMPTWNRFEPHISCRRRSSWLEPVFQVYCSRSKRMQAAEQEHGQAEIGIPAEQDVVDGVAHGGLLRRGWMAVGDDGALGLRHRHARRGPARRRAAWRRGRPCRSRRRPRRGRRVTSSSSQAASSAARSSGSGSGSASRAASASRVGLRLRRARRARRTPPRRASCACARRSRERGEDVRRSGRAARSASAGIARRGILQEQRQDSRAARSASAKAVPPRRAPCRSTIAWPRSRLSPCTCSNRCSDSERVRSNSRT